MKEYIIQRQSIRSYQLEKLPTEVLEKIQQRLDELIPLFDDINYEVRFLDRVSGLFGVKAPHYLAFYSEEKAGYLENIGFIGQQLSLYLNSLSIGSCWLGVARSQEKESTPGFVICLALGYPRGDLFRQLADFKRKDISKISNVDNEISQVVRLAPSAMNLQDWYFYQQDNLIHCYCQIPDFLKARLLGKRMGKIDMGIAMCHIAAVVTNYKIIKSEEAPDIAGYRYFRSFLLA